jgi:hypothetical protein
MTANSHSNIAVQTKSDPSRPAARCHSKLLDIQTCQEQTPNDLYFRKANCRSRPWGMG